MEIDILNKIKWDSNIIDKDHCTIWYQDRIEGKLKPIQYSNIWEWDNFSMRIFKPETNEDVDIPLHRIKKIIDSKGNTLFERQT